MILHITSNIDNSPDSFLRICMHAGTTAMGDLQMRQPGSSAAANGISAQAAAIGQQLIATGQHQFTMP